jgi:hypothetical protein
MVPVHSEGHAAKWRVRRSRRGFDWRHGGPRFQAGADSDRIIEKVAHGPQVVASDHGRGVAADKRPAQSGFGYHETSRAQHGLNEFSLWLTP